MSLFELRNIRVVFDGRVVLDLPEFSIQDGVVYALQGPNGAGKSTLLGILSLLNPPHEGEVRFEGSPVVWQEACLRPLRRRVGLVEQHPVMFSCSVRDNVGYGLDIRGVDKTLRNRLVGEALDLVGLGHLAGAHAPRLSGGETQRVAIARALANRPKVLLLDEPTASVDTQNRVIIEQVVAELRDRGDTTIVLCTHNRSQARSLCPERINLEEGRLVARTRLNSYAGLLDTTDGQTWCRIGDSFRVPVTIGGSGRVRVSIDPDAVRLTRSLEPGLNCGILERIRLEDEMVSLDVKVGLSLQVQMRFEEFRTSGFSVGDLVQVQVPASAVECQSGR